MEEVRVDVETKKTKAKRSMGAKEEREKVSLVRRVFEESKCTNANDTELADLHVSLERALAREPRREAGRFQEKTGMDRRRRKKKGRLIALSCSLEKSPSLLSLSLPHSIYPLTSRFRSCSGTPAARP